MSLDTCAEARPRSTRSRACKQCLERRVKCDGRAGSCKQCTRFGLACSGAVQGPIIIDLTQRVSHIRKKTKRKNNTSNDSTTTLHLDDLEPRMRIRQTKSSEKTITPVSGMSDSRGENTISRDSSHVQHDSASPVSRAPHGPGQYSHLRLSQIFQNEIYQESFIAQFVQSTMRDRRAPSSCRRSWFADLPLLLSGASASPSLTFSIRAAAMGYYALVQGNRDAEIDAVRWYNAGLRSHRVQLEKQNQLSFRQHVDYTREGNSNTITTTAAGLFKNGQVHTEDIMVSVLLSFFEIIAPTTPDAWAQHQAAAVSIFQLRGPLHCQNAPKAERSLFRSLRGHQAFYSVLKNEPSALSSPEWRSIPFHHAEKHAFDLLVDILLSFPHNLGLLRSSLHHTLREAVQTIKSLDEASRRKLEQSSIKLMDSLEGWRESLAREYPSQHLETTLAPLKKSETQRDNTGSDQTISHPSLWPNPPMSFDYHDTYLASTLAVFHAAKLIVHAIMLQLRMAKTYTDESSAEVDALLHHRTAMALHSSEIIRAAAYHIRRHRLCGDTLRTAFGLKAVSYFAWNITQQRTALELLASWGYYKESSRVPRSCLSSMPF
ncbi:hypothetical protein EDD36DRAFT_109682 [Exophiala viscosa]|uniref:Zn(2)-C6 fungal-type domain-containing protein n=1 Tax=Exophiala viscosa TaxID=2486360 RepID=A0AAN6I8R0_9EURO|nr:hypothetical protein EDD36DRAFT_109682 [Exophiala viscosa]